MTVIGKMMSVMEKVLLNIPTAINMKATGQMISNTERGLTFSIQETAMRVLIS